MRAIWAFTSDSAMVMRALPWDSICWSLAFSSLTSRSFSFFTASWTATFLSWSDFS